MTKDEFLELKKKHSYKNQYKVADEKELRELIQLAESIDVHMDLNWLDVSNVTDIGGLFYNSKFNGDISKWDVSNAENMCCMFQGSDFNGDISKWDVSNVRSMSGMFKGSKFNGDISKWDVSNVRNMCCMFQDTPFNGDIGEWNVSKVTDMRFMFANTQFNGNISKWDVSNVLNGTEFNPYLDIIDESDLKNYVSFLRSIYDDKPINVDIKKAWLKTRDVVAYVANRLNRDADFVNKIKKVLCSEDTND